MKRYPRSSYSDEAIDDFAVDCRHLLQNGVTTNRRFYLRGMSITNTHASSAGTLYIYDSTTEGASPTATLQRLTVYVGPIDTAVFDFGAPGIEFRTGIIAGLAAAGATISAYGVTVWGYEEGGS